MVNRRQFIGLSAKTSLALGIGMYGLSSCAQENGKSAQSGGIPYTQRPLPYGYSDLDPAIDAMTMEIHYTKHAAGYASKLGEATKAEGVDIATTSLEQLLTNVGKYTEKMRNNAGGHFNHEMFWQTLQKPGSGNDSGKIGTAVNESFGSMDELKNKFNEAAKTRFGSGWAWLMVNKDKKLEVISTPNQDNPLMDIAEQRGYPVMGLDVWEHAYYLHYQNKRADYINAFWDIINWNQVNANYETALKSDLLAGL